MGYYIQNGVSIDVCAQIAGMTEDFIKLELTVTGTMGVLVKAKRLDFIEQVGTIVNDMRIQVF